MNNILVTGAKGFIGQRLCKQLNRLGYKVEEFDADLGDISEKDALARFNDKNINHVFHLAAKSFVPDSWVNPFDFYKTNVLGITNALEFCRLNKSKLTTISSYVYGAPDYLPIDENHAIKSYNPYSQTKVIGEEITEFYKKNYGIEVTIIRPFNIYGPNQSPAFLIPELIQKAKVDEVISLMDLTPKRDYLYVDDLVEALTLTIKSPSGTYNIGSGYSVSVEELVKLVMKIMCIDKPYESKNKARANEIYDVYADISKAKKELNWEPKLSIEEGLRKIIHGE